MKKKKGSVDIEIGGNVGGHVAIGDNINIYGNYQPVVSLHQLPSPPEDFVGRKEALAQLLKQERSAISGLSGLGGVGKTALGLVAAHEMAKTYNDAQFFIDLRGSSQNPLTPPEAMQQVILSFDPTADLRQHNDDQLKALYNSLLTGKRALLFFDNARDATQVRPLLPPPGCGVLVTSRTHFTLPGMGAPFRLNVLSEAEAISLLTKISPRTSHSAPQIAQLCGYLPLALRIAATFLAEHPDWTPAEYIEKLQKQRLETLKAEGDPAQDLEAVFELSYAQLSADEPTKWRTLSVFPASFRWEYAALLWFPQAKDLGVIKPLRDVISKFYRMNLLEYDKDADRYFMHDLLRDFAAAHIDRQEDFTSHKHHAEFFMAIAHETNVLYLKGGENVLYGLALFDSEWIDIQAAQEWAGQNLANGAAELALHLPGEGFYCLDLRLAPRQRIGWLETALNAARFLENKNLEAVYLNNLGLAYADLGEIHRAIELYEQALAIAYEIGNKGSETGALGNMGVAYYALGEIHRAIELYEQILVIYRETDDKRNEGASLGNLGLAYYALGENHRAIELYKQALAVHREIGDKRGEGDDLGNLGNAYYNLGEPRRAIEFYEQQLTIAREIGDKHSQGNALFNIGFAHQKLGDLVRARELEEQGLEIFIDIESPNTKQARKWLESLPKGEE